MSFAIVFVHVVCGTYWFLPVSRPAAFPRTSAHAYGLLQITPPVVFACSGARSESKPFKRECFISASTRWRRNQVQKFWNRRDANRDTRQRFRRSQGTAKSFGLVGQSGRQRDFKLARLDQSPPARIVCVVSRVILTLGKHAVPTSVPAHVDTEETKCRRGTIRLAVIT